MTGAAPAQPALACGGNQVGILGKGHYCVGRAGEPPRAPSQTASPFPHGIAVALAPCEPRGARFSFACADKQLSPGYWQDYDIRRAFTAQIIIDKLKKRDGITIDNMTEALDRCVEDGVKEIVVQPTHLMAGLEYADVKDELDKYADKFDKISLGDPLLTSDDDYKKVAAAINENMASFDDGKTALCLMGHGTEADSNADYAKMQEVFKNEGLTQFFVGTVEAEPTCEDVIAAASAAGYKKAVLAPFMVVAGDHDHNVLVDETDPDSWAAKFVAAGFEVTCLLQGLGQNAAVDDIYVSHVDDAIAKL